MRLRKLLFVTTVLVVLIPGNGNSWGKTGHRVVGAVAEKYISKKAMKNIREVLGKESLAMAGNWMDFIRSDPSYDHTHAWHYATIPDGKTYEEAGTPGEGDIIGTINRLIGELKSGNFSEGGEVFALKCLVHLIGDLHQPLHVGNGSDRGGNDVKIRWFFQNSNLHRVWDSQMIDDQQLSYTELAESINHPADEQLQLWMSGSALDWAYESMEYRSQVYKLPDDNSLSYRYMFDNWSLVEKRLLQAGIRLAFVLNDIYEGK